MIGRMRLWWFEAKMHPVRKKGGAYAWHVGGREGWRCYLWLAVPKRIQRRLVRWYNVRHCARHGHDDMLWHLESAGIAPRGETNCSNCNVKLTACEDPVGHAKKANS